MLAYPQVSPTIHTFIHVLGHLQVEASYVDDKGDKKSMYGYCTYLWGEGGRGGWDLSPSILRRKLWNHAQVEAHY